MAPDCIDALRAADLRQDIGGRLTDPLFADRFAPPLTAIHYSQNDMGRNAAEMLMGQIARSADDVQGMKPLRPASVPVKTVTVARAATDAGGSSFSKITTCESVKSFATPS